MHLKTVKVRTKQKVNNKRTIERKQSCKNSINSAVPKHLAKI